MLAEKQKRKPWKLLEYKMSINIRKKNSKEIPLKTKIRTEKGPSNTFTGYICEGNHISLPKT